MKDEIVAGLKNAMERGSSLQQAAQSFINAGYNPYEVKAAEKMLSSGASEIIYAKEEEGEKHSLPQLPKKKTGRRKVLTIAIVVLALVVFISALFYLASYFAE